MAPEQYAGRVLSVAVLFGDLTVDLDRLLPAPQAILLTTPPSAIAFSTPNDHIRNSFECRQHPTTGLRFLFL